MMLDFVLVADSAHVTNGKLYLQGGGVTRFNVPQFPFVVPSIAAVVRMILEPEDIDRERMVGFRWYRDGEPIVPQIEGPIRPNPPLGPVEGEESAALIVSVFNGLPLERAGLYEVEVTLDGELFARKGLRAVQV